MLLCEKLVELIHGEFAYNEDLQDAIDKGDLVLSDVTFLSKDMFSMGEFSCSAVKVYCNEDKEKIANCLSGMIKEKYAELMDRIEAEDGDCLEKNEEINIFHEPEITEDGILMRCDALAMYCCDGDYMASHDASEMLDHVLKDLKREYHFITYEGYIFYSWSDVNSGEACQYEFASSGARDRNDVTYEWAGRMLAELFTSEEVCEGLAGIAQDANSKERSEIVNNFQAYKEWIGTEKAVELIGIVENAAKGN